MTAEPLREAPTLALARALHHLGRTPEALRALEALRRRTVEDAGLDPSPAVSELQRRLLADDPALRPPAPAGARPHLTPGRHAPDDLFVGRRPELEALRSALRSHRAVTLVGPGGVGETRPALSCWTGTRATGGWSSSGSPRCPRLPKSPPRLRPPSGCGPHREASRPRLSTCWGGHVTNPAGLLAELVEASLAVADPAAPQPRFRLLEVMQRVALAHPDGGELDEACSGHTRWMQSVAEHVHRLQRARSPEATQILSRTREPRRGARQARRLRVRCHPAFVEIAGAGHDIGVEQPDAVAESGLRFLAPGRPARGLL